MRLWRLAQVFLVAGVAAGTAPAARAQTSLDHLVIVAPAAPGGGWDVTARVLQQTIERERLAGVVEVQNVPGAAGTIGLAQFVGAGAGDSRSLLVSGLVMLGATLWNDSPIAIAQATPIARLTGEYEVVAVPAASPHQSMGDLVQAFRARPEAFAWGGGSAGGTDHILAGLIAEAAGVDPRRVNYVAFSGGGEALAALLGGHVAAGISGYSEFAPHLASGRLRALAISAPSRVMGIEAPTLRDSGLDVELVNWRALLGAARLPAEARARLTTVVSRAAHSDHWRRMLTERGWTDLYLDGEAFEAFLSAERTRVGRVVARLRGPAHGTPVTIGQRLFPAVVCGGGLMVLVVFALKGRGRPPSETVRPNWPALASVAAGLLMFLVLVRPIGFVNASAVLFNVIGTALSHPKTIGGRLRLLALSVVFVLAVDWLFTHGLDLPLPRAESSAIPPWTR